MKLAQLEYFVAALEKGSFAAAGQELYITPQAVSHAVSELEDEVGSQLFYKSNNGIAPTPFGIAAGIKAREILRNVEELKRLSLLLDAQYIETGTLSVAIGHSSFRGSVIPRESINEFRKRYPSVALNVFLNSSGDCLSAVENGVVDTAIVLGDVELSSCSCMKLTNIEPKLLVSESHPFATKTNVGIAELLNIKVALPRDIRFVYPGLRELSARLDASPHFVQLGLSVEAHRDFVFEQQGAVLISPFMEKVCDVYPECVTLPVTGWEAFSVPIYFVSHSEAASSSRLLFGFLLEWFHEWDANRN